MEREETDVMVHFLFRMEMFISPPTKDNITSFMHGTDYGRPVKLKWTELLKDHISNKYRLEGGALGWPHQITLFSEKNSTDWTQSFKLLMIELMEESEHIEGNKLLTEFKRGTAPDN